MLLAFGLSLLVLADAAEAVFCWKPTHTRGVGKVPTGCGPNREYRGGLCWEPCKDGYAGASGMCWQRCPDGFRDDGAFCFKPEPLGRGPGLTGRGCNDRFGYGNCVKRGLLWYRRCPSGFREAGVLVCSPSCPGGMTDIGISCAKKSYVSDGGGVPTGCPAGHERDTGLCYPNCRSGYAGVGPVCWGRCPINMDDCPRSGGAGCASSPQACRGVVKQQVISSLRFIANVATFMTANAGTLTADEIDRIINDSLKTAVEELRDQFVDEVKQTAQEVGVNIAQGTYDSLEQLIRDIPNRINIDWSRIDTTGIYELVNAFNHTICDPPGEPGKPEPPPQPIRVHLEVKLDTDKETCPKTHVLTGFIQYSDREPHGAPALTTARYRIVHNGKYSELYTEKTKEEFFREPFSASQQMRATDIVRVKQRVQLGPGKHEFRLEVRDSDQKGEAMIDVDCPPFEVTHAQLHFAANQGPVCPQKVLTQEIFITTRPGTVEYRRERQGGEPSGWLKLETQLIAGQYQAVLSDVQSVGEIDQVRRVVANRWHNKPGTIASDWVRTKTNCIDVVDHEIFIDGPDQPAQCPIDARVRVRLNTDMEGPVSYRVDCDNGGTFSGTPQAKSSGPDTYIAVASKEVAVTKTGKLVCALKVQKRQDQGFQPVDLRGKDFICRGAGPQGPSSLVPDPRPDSQAPPAPEPVVDPPRSCPHGSVGRWPNCRKQTCAPGTVGKWPDCKKRDCPAGTIGEWPDCKKRDCPAGTIGEWPNCKRRECPAGTAGQWPNCKQRACPQGSVGKWPNCSKRDCPPGQVRVRGRCIKPAG
jgi:hypothetical protein